MIRIERHLDDRGELEQVLPLPILKTKRAYITTNRKGVVRGFHGHQRENKAIFVIEGTIKVLVFSMENVSQPSKMFKFTLSESMPQALYIPRGNYHGYSALSEKSRVLIYSV